MPMPRNSSSISAIGMLAVISNASSSDRDSLSSSEIAFRLISRPRLLVIFLLLPQLIDQLVDHLVKLPPQVEYFSLREFRHPGQHVAPFLPHVLNVELDHPAEAWVFVPDQVEEFD